VRVMALGSEQFRERRRQVLVEFEFHAAAVVGTTRSRASSAA
jgi:hypothetical protein